MLEPIASKGKVFKISGILDHDSLKAPVASPHEVYPGSLGRLLAL